jgi:polyisoprenoid-binding protein YceI
MEVSTFPAIDNLAATGPQWRIDPTHSMIRFSIRHMVVATVHGRFDGPYGTIRFDRYRPWTTEVMAELDPASVNTGIRKRDEHLRSRDFFDVATYPAIRFRSTEIRPVSSARSDHWHMVGDLSMHGTTRTVDLDVRQVRTLRPQQPDVLRFRATCSLDRKDFGMTFNLAVEGGSLIVGNEVRVVINVKALRVTS